MFGLRGRLSFADVSGSNTPTAAALASPAGYLPNEILGHKTSWIAALSGRIGYAVQPQSLAYAVGGVGWVRNRYSDEVGTLAFSGTATATRSGWLIGAGLEHQLHRNWSVFGEYNFIALGGDSVTLNYNQLTTNGTRAYRYRHEQNLQTIMLGLNYRFGG